MKEFKETTYVVECSKFPLTVDCRPLTPKPKVEVKSFNFNTLSEAQSFTDQCLEEQRYNRVELFKEQHTRRRLSSSVSTGPPH